MENERPASHVSSMIGAASQIAFPELVHPRRVAGSYRGQVAAFPRRVFVYVYMITW